MRKARETNLPEIATTYIDQFNALRNIHKVKITTADPITDDMLNAILANVKATATEKLPRVIAMVDKLAKKSVIHKNKAANLKSKLTKKVNALKK